MKNEKIHVKEIYINVINLERAKDYLTQQKLFYYAFNTGDSYAAKRLL